MVLEDNATTSLHATEVTLESGEQEDLDTGEITGQRDDFYIETWLNVDEVASSNTAVATVSEIGGGIVIDAITPGTTTITVTLDNGFEYTQEVTVESGAREAETATAEAIDLTSAVEPGDITFLSEASVDAEVYVEDQYGDPLSGQGVWLISETDSEDDPLFEENHATSTETGLAEIVVEAENVEDSGTYEMLIFDEANKDYEDDADDAIGTLVVNYTAPGTEVDSYELRFDSDSLCDGTGVIDAYTDATSTLLRFVALDADGNVLAEATTSVHSGANTTGTIGFDSSVPDRSKLDFEITGDLDAINASSSMGKIELEAQEDEEGTVTVTVKDGELLLDSMNITIEWSAPDLEGFNIEVDEPFEINATDTSPNMSTSTPEALVSVFGTDDFDFEVSTSTFDTYSTSSSAHVVTFDVEDEDGRGFGTISFQSDSPSKFQVGWDLQSDDLLNFPATGAVDDTAKMTVILRDTKEAVIETKQIDVELVTP